MRILFSTIVAPLTFMTATLQGFAAETTDKTKDHPMTQTALKPQQEMLPTWDLTDFYQSPQDPQLETDLSTLKSDCESFAKSYTGVFTESTCEGKNLLQSILDMEAIDLQITKLYSYSFLNYATQINNPEAQQLYQRMQEQLTALSAHLIFYGLDINRIDDTVLLAAYSAEPGLLKYKSWIEEQRMMKPHQLSSDLEKLMVEKSLTSNAAWVRLYDETLEGIRFNFEDKELPLSEILDKLSHRDAAVREAGAKSLSEGLSSRLSIFTLVTNTLAKDKEINDTWRKFPTPVSSKNLSNQIEDEVVEALRIAVKAAYPSLSHRYYALKAKWMGVEKLEYWDRNAPLLDAPDKTISWDHAKEIVYNAYYDFSPELASVGKRFFDHAWIDVGPKQGKRSGAFAHPTVPTLHPYLMLNFQGKLRDVMTLAHELGHGVHQVLAGAQGQLLCNTPLTIAETASVFGEMLTFRALLNQTESPAQRRSLIAEKVSDMLNTVVRQIAFFDFEKQVHDRRRQGDLSSEEIGKIWMDTQREALGSSVNLDPIVTPYWSYISHFIHSPFYVYSYAFGDCLVNSLYSVFEQGHPGFQEKYLDLLKAGGSKRYPELLAPFGLNPKDPAFWSQGLKVVSNLIDELEQLGDL